MLCAWEALLNILPMRFRTAVDRQGRAGLQELRLRSGQSPQLDTNNGTIWLQDTVTASDIQFTINAASKYSPWSAESIRHGYITAPGGHRIGICGEAILKNGQLSGFQRPAALCIRIARDFPDISKNIMLHEHSLLILGPPGSGKTTLLRDLIRRYSNSISGSIGVIDERNELFPIFNDRYCFDTGKKTDIITGCGKRQGIETILRCMSTSMIAVDEITAADDCSALIQAGWCGVKLLATAHAANLDDLHMRPVYKPIIESQLFDAYITLKRDKTWHMERVYK